MKKKNLPSRGCKLSGRFEPLATSVSGKPKLPIATVREGVKLLLERNGGPTFGHTFDGHTYVLVRATDFAALEHYYKNSDWV